MRDWRDLSERSIEDRGFVREGEGTDRRRQAEKVLRLRDPAAERNGRRFPFTRPLRFDLYSLVKYENTLNGQFKLHVLRIMFTLVMRTVGGI